MTKKDYYLILEVDSKASAEDIKRAYRKLALRYHPDKNPNDRASEERFKELGEAYEILRDPFKRNLYDQWRNQGEKTKAGRSTPPPKASQSARKPSKKSDLHDEDTFEGFIHDIFGDFFGKSSSQPASSSASERAAKGGDKGMDLRYHLNISLEEAATGCDRSIQFVRQRGKKQETTKIVVKIPAGVEAGQRLRVAGEGDSITESSPPGDLFVVVDIKKHSLFHVEGNDVHLQLPLTFSQAAFGCTEKIPTPTGFVSVDIPPGTPSGRIFRLRNKGYPKLRSQESGDLLVKVVIDAPVDLSREQKELLSRFESSKIVYSLRDDYEKAVAEIRRTRP